MKGDSTNRRALVTGRSILRCRPIRSLWRPRVRAGKCRTFTHDLDGERRSLRESPRHGSEALAGFAVDPVAAKAARTDEDAISTPVASSFNNLDGGVASPKFTRDHETSRPKCLRGFVEREAKFREVQCTASG